MKCPIQPIIGANSRPPSCLHERALIQMTRSKSQAGSNPDASLMVPKAAKEGSCWTAALARLSLPPCPLPPPTAVSAAAAWSDQQRSEFRHGVV